MKTFNQTVMLWKLDIFKLAVQCGISTITAYLGFMANQHWSDLDGDSKFKIILGLTSGNLTLIYTYITLASKQLAKGVFIPPNLDDTSRIEK